jgi:hypothetical protein
MVFIFYNKIYKFAFYKNNDIIRLLERGYNMQKEYSVDNLVLGELVTVHTLGGTAATIPTVMGPFIFNKIPTKEGKKQMYKEVFTGDVYKESKSEEKQKFGKTYVNVVGNLYNYLTQEEITNKQISSSRILDIYTSIVKQESIIDQQKTSKVKTKK